MSRRETEVCGMSTNVPHGDREEGVAEMALLGFF